MTDDDSDFNFDALRSSLDAFKRGKVAEKEIREQWGDVPGIDRSIAIARARRTQSMRFEELDDMVDIHLDEDPDHD